jgi:hypothetical protein
LDASDTHRVAWYLDALLVFTIVSVAFGFAVFPMDAAKIDGEYIPRHSDSFYHATRVLAAYDDSSAFVQWDEDSFWPGGAFNAWPWFYDFSVTQFLRVISPDDPVMVMVHIPTVWILVNCLLLFAICRQLNMGWPARAMALLCFAFSPLTQLLHVVGRIDHHFMEYTMVLATLASLLWWMQRPEAVVRAAVAGFVPGIAVGINSGLFILQAPILLAFAVFWLRGVSMPKRSVWFAIAVMCLITLLLVMFSQPALVGMFRYDLLSWFHLYVACCSGLGLILVTYFSFSYRHLALFVVAAVLLSIPLANEYRQGLEFLQAGGGLMHIAETRSVLSRSGFFLLTHSWLLLITPLTMIGCLYVLATSAHRGYLILAACSVFGLMLLWSQHRLHYYGSFALYVPPLLAIQHWLARYGGKAAPVGWSAALVIVAAANFGSAGWMLRPVQAGDGNAYKHDAFDTLEEICAETPATVLAPIDVAHQLRYFTNCRIMANQMQGIDFIATVKADRVRYLLSLSPDELRAAPDEFQYVWIENTAAVRKGRPLEVVRLGLSRYFFDDIASPPAGYELLSYRNVRGPWWWASETGRLHVGDDRIVQLDDDWFVLDEVAVFKVEKRESGL